MKYKKLSYIFLFLLFFSLCNYRTILAFGSEDSLKILPKKHLGFVFKLDNRFSFAGKEFITIYGFRMGAKIQKRHELGVSLNWIGSNNFFELPTFVKSELAQPNFVPTQARLLYRYAGLFYEYSFFQRKRWSMSVPLQFGTGKAGIDIQAPDGTGFIERRLDRFFLFEPSFNADYKVVRFAGIGAGIGYRFAYSEQHIVQSSLTKPVFILKVKIYLGEIFRSVRKKDYRFFYFE
ncbi:MAG: hypothetical protein EAZ08_05125 [Cytophagales bacterium]|nr:MAG: hypothetical protein EAZ08_05125 [Cytophagales bacterium]